MARLQLAKQELQDRCHKDFEKDMLLREVHYLKKELATVQEKINENMELVCYQVAELMWFIDTNRCNKKDCLTIICAFTDVDMQYEIQLNSFWILFDICLFLTL